MSLFGDLLYLHSEQRRRVEDFHSTIVAHVLKRNPSIVLGWLRQLGVTNAPAADEVVVSTQQRFAPVEGLHDAGSRPDIIVRIRQHERVEVVFIESKVGSEEGRSQLPNYADQLRALRGVDQRSLLFITRDYEPKDDLSDKTVRFFPARWSEFFRFLSAIESPSETIKELLKFMKEHNMSQSNRFTAIESLALTNHHRARALMDATMWESITKRFQKVCGATGSIAKAMSQLRIHNRYVMVAGHGTGYQIEMLLGYWFPDDQPAESPDVGVHIYVNPKAAERPAIARAMLKFSEASKGEWENWDLGNDREWAGIGRTRKLESFFSEEDHVAAIVKFFDELLTSVAAFRKQNPKLPWSAQAAGGDDDE